MNARSALKETADCGGPVRADFVPSGRHDLLQAVFEHAALGIAVADLDGVLIHTNPALERMLGRRPGELCGATFRQMAHPDDLPADGSLFRGLVRGERPEAKIEIRFVRRDGGALWGRLSVSLVRDGEGDPEYLLAMVEDVTEKKAAEEQVERERAYFERLFESIPAGVALLDTGNRILRINPEFTRLFGYAEQEAIGRNLHELIVPEGKEEESLATTRRAAGGERVKLETSRCRKDGKTVEVSVVGAPVRLHGSEVAVYGIYQDIGERKSMEEALRRLSNTDMLTGLLNRRGFLSLAGHMWDLARRRDQEMLLIYLDVDELKQVNDAHGHAEGDRVLQDAARLMRSTFRSTDVLGRLGGDEFVVLCVDAEEGWAPIERLNEAVARYNAARPGSARLTMSVGSVGIPARDTTSLDAALAEADRQMYRMKHGRRENVGR